MLRRKLKLASDTNSGDDTSKPKKLKKSSQTAIITSSPHFKMPLWQRVYNIECRLSAELKELNFLSTKVAAVYNPVEYAAELHCAYLQKFLTDTKSVLFIGMNPGPWGMVQTGVTAAVLISHSFMRYLHYAKPINYLMQPTNCSNLLISGAFRLHSSSS